MTKNKEDTISAILSPPQFYTEDRKLIELIKKLMKNPKVFEELEELKRQLEEARRAGDK